MGAIQPWHIILIVVVFLLLFGGKKLPDAARGLGRSLRILKSEVGAMHDEDGSKAKVAADAETEASAAVATPASMIAPAPVAQQPVVAQPVYQQPVAVPVTAPAAAPQPMSVQQVPVAVPATMAPPVINVPAGGSHPA